MKYILSYLKPLKWRITKGLAVKIAATFAELGIPWLLSYIINNIIPLGKISYIAMWGTLMFVLAFISRTFNVKANRMAAAVARESVEKIRHDLFVKIFSLSGRQMDEFSVSSLISRMTSDSYNIHQMIGMVQRLGVRAPLILIGGVVITFTLEPVLTLVLIAVLPFLAYIVYYVSRRGIPLYLKTQKVVDKLVRIMRENINGIRVIKALSKTEYEKQRFEKVNNELFNSEWAAAKTMAVSGPCMDLLLNLGLTLIVIVGAFRINSGAAEGGTIVAFLTYFTMILNALLGINRMFVVFSKASASAKRMAKVANAPVEMYAVKNLEGSRKETFIEFKNVSFAYNSASNTLNSADIDDNSETEYAGKREEISSKEKECLSNISFDIKKGESLGIIGATGSGKTTIINLMMRFYETVSGNIYIDGKDIRSYKLEELRKKFGVVFQNDIIFKDTILENIDFGREISFNQIEAAAVNANALDFILEKDGGFSYKAAIKGADFSGGQKQRLLIARALASNPEILVLDDSSSALDYKTDAALRQAINKNYKETTMVLVAQRVSSVMHLDHILVLDDGKMIGYGTHKELIKECEVYKEIYDLQMGYGIKT